MRLLSHLQKQMKEVKKKSKICLYQYMKKKARVQYNIVKNQTGHHTNKITMTMESERTRIFHAWNSTEKKKAVESQICVLQDEPILSFAPFMTICRSNYPTDTNSWRNLGKKAHNSRKKRTCNCKIMDFQLLLVSKIKLMRNTASFFIPQICESLHPSSVHLQASWQNSDVYFDKAFPMTV